ncbi:shikimate kinase [Bacteroidota bacterium]
MRIFLVGYMGCGKSTVAKKLGKKMNLQVVDLDAEIVKEVDKTIPEIFKTVGEEGFRRLERKVLRKWLDKDNYVLATGGGAPCFFESMDEMNAAGTAVYLKMSPKALVDRILSSPDERPLLKGLSPEKMLEKVDKQLEKREKFYGKAEVIANGFNIDIEELAALLSHSK